MDPNGVIEIVYPNNNNNNNNNNKNNNYKKKTKIKRIKGRWQGADEHWENEVERGLLFIFSYLRFFLRFMEIGP